MNNKKLKPKLKPVTMKPDRLLSLKEVAEIFGVSTATITRYDAELTPTKTFGGHRRYKQSTIDEVIAKNGK
jgi:predicted DNA-binding transcriptional regulator AlpA